MDSRDVDPNPCELDAATMQRLTELVSRAHARTSATGVAIALVEDDDLVTCAAFGASAPEVGTRSPIATSLSGRCAKSGEMVVVADVTTDERVDGEACASAGIFSIVLVPVSESGKTRGVLAAFADRPNSFSPNQMTVLNTFAEIANELLQHRDQAASGEQPTPVGSVTDPSAKCETVLHDVLSAYEADRRAKQAEAARIAAKPAAESTRVSFTDAELPARSVAAIPDAAKPAVAATTVSEPTIPGPKQLTAAARASEATMVASTPVPTKTSTPAVTPIAAAVTPEKLGPRIVRPAATRGAAATQMALAPEPVTPPISRPEPVKVDSSRPKDNTGLLSFAVDPMPTKQGPATGNPRAERSSPMPEKQLFSNYDTPAETSGISAKVFIAAGVMALVLAGGVFGYSRMTHQKQVMAAPRVQEPTAAVTTPEPVAVGPVSNAAVATSTPTTPPPPPSSDARALSAASVAAKAQQKQTEAPKLTHEQPAEVIDPTTIKQPNASVKKKPLDVPDVQAPTLTAGLTAGKMPEFHATVVPPKADFPVANVIAPKLLNGPRPAFPMAAKTMHLDSDTVVLNAKVLPNGHVGDISVVRGHPVFVEAVKDAVKRWQYSPAQLNNQPTEATLEIVFKFGQQ